MPKLQYADLDFQNVNRLLNLPQANAPGQPVTFEQLDSVVTGLAWKDNVRLMPTTNINLAAPGAIIDGITMAPGDRFAPAGQTTQSENGIYVWTGSASPATRSLDADTADGLENAVIAVDEGTRAGTTWRQTTVNFTLGTGNIAWAPFGGSSQATEALTGTAEIATQAETDAGLDDLRIVTPLKLRNSSLVSVTKKFTVGDGSATSFTCAHNFNTFDVSVEVVEVSGNRRTVEPEIRRISANEAVVLANPAPATNSLFVYVTKLAIVS